MTKKERVVCPKCGSNDLKKEEEWYNKRLEYVADASLDYKRVQCVSANIRHNYKCKCGHRFSIEKGEWEGGLSPGEFIVSY